MWAGGEAGAGAEGGLASPGGAAGTADPAAALALRFAAFLPWTDADFTVKPGSDVAALAASAGTTSGAAAGAGASTSGGLATAAGAAGLTMIAGDGERRTSTATTPITAKPPAATPIMNPRRPRRGGILAVTAAICPVCADNVVCAPTESGRGTQVGSAGPVPTVPGTGAPAEAAPEPGVSAKTTSGGGGVP